MKYKGLNRDVPNSEIPEGFGVDARNGINSKFLGAAINEGGFKAFQKAGSSNKFALGVTISGVTYYRKQCGEVALDLDRFLICSIGYGPNLTPDFSEIGLLSSDGQYTSLIRDINFTTKLGFSLQYPFTGEYTKNYLNETIVTLTDNNTKPLFINIDTYITTPVVSGTFDLNRIYLFPDVDNVDTNITISDTGGNLDNGIYYLVYKYYTSDFALTNGLLPTRPISIYEATLGNTNISIDSVQGDLENKTTSKSITVDLFNVNTSFEGIKVYGVIKRQGIFTARELKDVKISNQVNLSFTIDSSNGTEVDYKGLITPSITFSKVYKFTQVVKRLYAARPKINQFRDLQRVANKVRVKWVAKKNFTRDSSYSPAKKDFNHDTKTFAPREVYAFYLVAELTDGTITEGFHIPALSHLTEAQIISAGYRDASTEAADQSIVAKKFQVEDTATCTNSGSSTGATGEMGLWENQETYPNLPEYEDFAGKPIRHHRFPSINFFREKVTETAPGSGIFRLPFNIVQGTAAAESIGVEWLPDLGIRVENVNIPVEIRPFIKSWFIAYAKRNYNNSTVIGTSTIGFQSTRYSDYPTGGQKYPVSWYSGFNNIIQDVGQSISIPYTPFLLNRTVAPSSVSPDITNKALVRFQDFNLVKNTPDINPVFIANELFLRTNMVKTANNNSDGTNGKRAVLCFDFTGKAFSSNQKSLSTSNLPVPNFATSDFNPSPISTIPINTRLRKINTYNYLVQNSVTPEFNNSWLEDTLVLDIDCTVDGSNNVLHKKTFPIGLTQDATNVYYPTRYEWKSQVDFTGIHETYLTTLLNLPNNVYNSMFEQELVITGERFYDVTNTTSGGSLYTGDCFNGLSSYHTAGWGAIPSANLTTGSNGENFAGLRALWIHITPSPINLALRTSATVGPELQFYPKVPVTYVEHINTYTIQSNKQYNMDYSSVNDVRPVLPYNPFIRVVEENFYRINRTIVEQSESTDIGWRTWLANDYYEVPRNKGKITNIEGVDRNLIIQTENTSYITVGNEQLNIGNATAFVGAGNIFERPAMEYLPSKEGSIGTLDRFSCILTAFGYISVDRKKGTVLLLTDSPSLISRNGMARWLFENLDYNTTIITANRTVVVPDNPYCGFGIHTGIDYEFNRLLITKKHYELTELALEYLNNNSGNRLRFENNVWVWYTPIGLKLEVGYDNTNFFKNKSFTLSYDLASNTFTYFHDYFPIRYMVRRQSIIAVSSKLVNNVLPFNFSSNHFIMNQVNKGVYENTVNIDVDNPVLETAQPYTFYIVPVIALRTVRAQLLDLKFQTDCVKSVLKSLGNEERYYKEPPSTILVFNSFQSTPVIPLVPTTGPSTLFSSNIRLIKGMWNFNKIKDWLSKETFDTNAAFITDYSNLVNSEIDLNKPKQNITPLTDQWFAVKLSYINLDLQNPKEFRILQLEFSLLPVTR